MTQYTPYTSCKIKHTTLYRIHQLKNGRTELNSNDKVINKALDLLEFKSIR